MVAIANTSHAPINNDVGATHASLWCTTFSCWNAFNQMYATFTMNSSRALIIVYDIPIIKLFLTPLLEARQEHQATSRMV